MAAVDTPGDSRPPPSRQKSLTLFTPGIPWYRDLRVLRLIAQAVFAVLVIGAVIFLRNNLVTNLEASNIPVNFEVYSSPFSVAVSEGVSLTSTWSWADNQWFSYRLVRVLLGFSVFALAYVIITDYQEGRNRLWAAAAAALFGLCALYDPDATRLTFEVITEEPASGGLEFVIWGIWLALLATAVYITYRLIGPQRIQSVVALAGAAIPFMIAIEFSALRIEDWLANDTFMGDLIFDSPILPDALVTLFAVLIWLIPLLTAFGLALYIYFHELADSQTLITGAGLLFVIMLLLPTGEAAAQVWTFTREYLAPATTTRAFITGIYNTLRVVIASLVACTVLGILVGIGLLSSNFLVRNVSKVYVEIFRNTPLLIQLLFIYRTLTLLLPSPRESIRSPDNIGPLELNEKFYFLNARGLWHPSVNPTDQFLIFGLGIVLGLVAFYFVRRWRIRVQDMTGQPAYLARYALPAFLICAAIGWLLAGGWPLEGGPLRVAYPFLAENARNVEGGTRLSLGFVSLFLGLTLYTAAFIADIVRAGIQSVSFGQIEAARAQGLRGSQVLSHVILPQALRLIIPPLGNQYVNLGKNSSLGIVVTYFDTYRVAQLANNETGQAVAFFVGLMAIYLVISLILSALTNIVNRATRVKTR